MSTPWLQATTRDHGIAVRAPNSLADLRVTAVSRRRLLVGSLLGSVATLGGPARKILAQATPFSEGKIPLGEAFSGLSPYDVWKHFYELTQIPRTSHHEAQVSAFVADFGHSLGLETNVDSVGNVLIRKPALPGMEDRLGVVLQAHMDMVPAKNPESDHDFVTDPIDAYLEDGWVRAEGTTLGADNGIGVAMIMALLQADELQHGGLEGLFTVNEEDGFTGADALEPGVLRGDLLINVDSEEEGMFTIGCAGGVDIDAELTYGEESAPPSMAGVGVTVSGLQGGHSGIDIGKGRGNAIKLLARLFYELGDEMGLRLASATGGDRNNAIPREAKAVAAAADADFTSLQSQIGAFVQTVRAELAGTEPDLRIEVVRMDSPLRVMDSDSQRRVIDALNGCPNGVVRMSDSVPGLVETSANLGTLALEAGSMQAGLLVRSSVDSARDAARDEIASVFTLAGANVSFHDEYPGWTPNPDSPLLLLMQETYRDVFDAESGVMAVHAGLETSKFAETYPEMDMISLGPTLQNVHSPDEQLDVASVEKTWELLVAAIARVPARDPE